MHTPTSPVVAAYRFGQFRLLISDRILERNGERVPLTPKVIDTLFVLIENAPRVVSKEAIIQAVWPDVTVVESGLTRNISSLRKALESDVAECQFLETIPRRGYRFVAEIIEERTLPPTVHPTESAPRATHRKSANPQRPAAIDMAVLLAYILLSSSEAGAELARTAPAS